jgi:hypothetical protein
VTVNITTETDFHVHHYTVCTLCPEGQTMTERGATNTKKRETNNANAALGPNVYCKDFSSFGTSERFYISLENTGGKGSAMEEQQRQKERPRTAMHCSAISQSIAAVRQRPRRNGMTTRSWILCACLFLVLLNPNTAQSPTTATGTCVGLSLPSRETVMIIILSLTLSQRRTLPLRHQ